MTFFLGKQKLSNVKSVIATRSKLCVFFLILATFPSLVSISLLFLGSSTLYFLGYESRLWHLEDIIGAYVSVPYGWYLTLSLPFSWFYFVGGFLALVLGNYKPLLITALSSFVFGFYWPNMYVAILGI